MKTRDLRKLRPGQLVRVRYLEGCALIYQLVRPETDKSWWVRWDIERWGMTSRILYFPPDRTQVLTAAQVVELKLTGDVHE